MAGSLDGVRVKLARASEHIAELRRLVDLIIEESARSIVCEEDGDPRKLVFRMTRSITPDPRIQAIVGDILYCCRSALDHLAWQLVLLDGGTPNEGTQFPIYTTPLNDKGNPRNVTIQPGITNPDILKGLVQVQPFTQTKYGHDPADTAISILNDLCNIDKHRLLLTLITSLDGDMPAYWGLGEGAQGPKYRFLVGPLEAGSVVARFWFDDQEVPKPFEPHLSLVVSIWEEKSRWLRLQHIADGLEALRRSVAMVINLHFVTMFDTTYVA